MDPPAFSGCARAYIRRPGEEAAVAPGDKEPVLRLEAEGPTSFVTALAFSADGRTLYAGGWDKVLRVWTLNDKGFFVPDRLSAYRVPIGLGLDGALNAIALSDDGIWLAAAGRAVFRQAAGFRQAGFIVPVAGGMTEAMRRDIGTIYVFNTKDQTVRLLTGHRGVVDKPRVTVRFQVRSVSPLTLVQVVRMGTPLSIDLSKVKRDGAGRERLMAETVVDLAEGLNSLWVEADNASGRQVGPVRVVTYCRPPLGVEIDKLVVKKVGGKEARVQHLPGGEIAFPEVDYGHVRQQGRIVWPDAKADPRRKNLRIRIYVNGFQQLQAYPGESTADGLQTPFEADLRLNLEKNNQVRLTVLGQDAGSPRSEFEVDCRQPIKRQRLHLLILGPQATDAEARKQEVLKAHQSQVDPQLLQAPVFVQVRVVVGSKFWSGYLYPQLVAMKVSISDLARTQQAPMNDVLLLYYQGGEVIRKNGNFFQTYSVPGRQGVKQFDIPCDDLVTALSAIE
jgi:hypothetical protein